MIYYFFAPGIPQPGGSKKGFAILNKETGKYRAVITEDNRKSKPWRETVQWSAREQFAGAPPLEGPLEVEFQFVLLRPKSHFGARGLRRSAPHYPTVKPDVTKLIRSTEDALKGIAWADDSQVVSQRGRKVYGDAPGAYIRIESMRVLVEDHPDLKLSEVYV